MINSVFQQNIISLSSIDPELAFSISQVKSTSSCEIILSRDGSPVPVINNSSGNTQLHSLYNPVKEGEKLYHSSRDESGFVIVFGLGGGYHILPYLNDPDIQHILIIETDRNIFRKIIENIDMTSIFSNRKTDLILDPDINDFKSRISEKYNPSIYGNLSIVQLKNRIKTEPDFFESAFKKIKVILDSVYDDFASQAQFGKRWFKNTLQNLVYAEEYSKPLSPCSYIKIAGAGPSIEMQIDKLKEGRDKSILIATDTVLPYLSGENIRPDIIISIDCQHITYNHFMGYDYSGIPAVLDLSSPPYLSRKFSDRIFFSSGHPFSRYLATYWKYFPVIDTSGGNVGHSAVSLANSLGAKTIELFGIDYSYPEGKPYARNSLIYNYFMKTEKRTSSCESSVYSFVFSGNNNFRINKSAVTNTKLESYYNYLSDFISDNNLYTVSPPDSPRNFTSGRERKSEIKLNYNENPMFFSSGKNSCSWKTFLENYKEKLKILPSPDISFNSYYQSLTKKEKELWATVFPVCASFRKEHKDDNLKIKDILNESKKWCIDEINKYL